MTLRQSETLLRALVALALGLGFIGFAAHASGAHRAHSSVSPDAEAVEVAATPNADAASHVGI